MNDQQGQPNRIPEFASIEEEAEFRDTHDITITDFLDELKPVNVRVSPNLTSVRHHVVRLDADDHAALSRHAREQEIDPSTLASTWIKERLRNERTG